VSKGNGAPEFIGVQITCGSTRFSIPNMLVLFPQNPQDRERRRHAEAEARAAQATLKRDRDSALAKTTPAIGESRRGARMKLGELSICEARSGEAPARNHEAIGAQRQLELGCELCGRVL